MPDIRHRVVISAPLESVYEAVATTEGISEWWTRDGVRGESSEGSKLQFFFGQPEPAAVMEVTRLDPDGHVNWNCVEGADEWVGTKLAFDLTHKDDETVVLFTHADWREPERVHGPLQRQVGLLPPEPQELRGDRQGHSLPRGLEVLTAGAEPIMVDVFKALADPSRRHLLDRLNARNGQNLRELSEGLDMARQSVSKHLAILEAANLVTTIRQGREKLHYLNAAPINEIAERWINRYDQERVRALSDLKRALEETPMEKPEFVYTTYIRTTPERLWQALTEPSFTRRWWQTTFETDWTVGSPMIWDNHGIIIADPEQVVLESDPYRRLAYSWHTFTPELNERLQFGDELFAKLSSERRSRVAFDIEPVGEMVKLTVVHDDFEPGSTAATMVRNGWPMLLSSLKTLLETGEPLASTRIDREAK